MVSTDWDRAGYTDESNGHLGKPVPTGMIVVPGDIALDGDALRWRLGSPKTRAKRPDQRMFNDFVRLWEEKPEAILRYAKEWGVLSLVGRRPCAEGVSEGTEPIEAWRFLSRRACAVLSISAAMTEGKLGSTDDWSHLAMMDDSTEQFAKVSAAPVEGLGFVSYSQLTASSDRRRAIARARGVIRNELNAWLTLGRHARFHGRSDFSVEWNPQLGPRGQWELQITYDGYLISAISLQMVLTVSGAASLYTCSGCGKFYIRPRDRKSPKAGQANFCHRCVFRLPDGRWKGTALKLADERRRDKMAETRRLHAAGIAVAEIAEKLHTKPATVRGWLKKLKKGK